MGKGCPVAGGIRAPGRACHCLSPLVTASHRSSRGSVSRSSPVRLSPGRFWGGKSGSQLSLSLRYVTPPLTEPMDLLDVAFGWKKQYHPLACHRGRLRSPTKVGIPSLARRFSLFPTDRTQVIPSDSAGSPIRHMAPFSCQPLCSPYRHHSAACFDSSMARRPAVLRISLTCNLIASSSVAGFVQFDFL